MTVVDPMSKVISFYGIGSGNDPVNRNIGFNVVDQGWQAFVNREVLPGLDLGITRYQLHNPAGTDNRYEMQVDQFLLAKNIPALANVLKDFAKVWKPITERAEVIAYLGVIKDPQNKLLESYKKDRTKKALWLQRLIDCYKLPLDAGMSLGFDAFFDLPEDLPEFSLFETFTNLGVRTYVEPWAHKDRPHFFKHNSITTEQLYRAFSPDWAARPEVITGEKVLLLNQPPPGKQWQDFEQWAPEWTQSMIAQGWSVSIPIYEQIRGRKDIRSWLFGGASQIEVTNVEPTSIQIKDAPMIISKP